MKRFPKRLTFALAILLFASCGTSNTEPDLSAELPKATGDVPVAESTPEVVVVVSEKIDAIVSKYEDDRREFMAAYRKASTSDEKNKIRQDMSPDSDQVASELLAIVNENSDDPASFEALSWIATNAGRGENYDAAVEQLFDKYIEREEMKDLCSAIAGGMPNQQIENRLRTLIQKSPHDDVKGLATYTLANYLARLPEMVEFADDPRAAKSLGEDGVAYLKNFVQNDQEVETLYATIINDYSDLMGPRDTLLSERAEKALYALRYLNIGKVAPDIEGTDLDGEAFKLSDYRGKVVMIDFWGDW